MTGCGPKGTRCRRSGDYVFECENHAVAAGRFWWWALWCIPGHDQAQEDARLKRELKAGVVSLREAQRMNRRLADGTSV